MSEYEKTNVARALLYWAKNNNGHEAYYLEDRMYAVADNDMVILLTADSYDEAIRKAKARHTQMTGDKFEIDELFGLFNQLCSTLVAKGVLTEKDVEGFYDPEKQSDNELIE